MDVTTLSMVKWCKLEDCASAVGSELSASVWPSCSETYNPAIVSQGRELDVEPIEVMVGALLTKYRGSAGRNVSLQVEHAGRELTLLEYTRYS